jgi:hypothetical protein
MPSQKGKRAKGVQMTEQQPKTPQIIDIFRNVVSDWTVILCFDWSVVYEMEISDWFLFLYSDWWMSDRLKYSYSLPLRTAW